MGIVHAVNRHGSPRLAVIKSTTGGFLKTSSRKYEVKWVNPKTWNVQAKRANWCVDRHNRVGESGEMNLPVAAISLRTFKVNENVTVYDSKRKTEIKCTIIEVPEENNKNNSNYTMHEITDHENIYKKKATDPKMWKTTRRRLAAQSVCASTDPH